MTEIKFRAYVPNKGWVQGFNLINCHNYYTKGLEPKISRYDTEWDIKDIHLMQYSLLKDKNEKEIFEGDIIDIHQTVNGCSKFVLLSCIGGYDVRYFIDGSYSMPYEYDVNELLDVEVEDKEIEVVGNIHQLESYGKET